MPATVVFCMLQEAGHLNPTFKLARSLVRRGLDVRYFAAKDVAPLVADHGFPVLSWFPEMAPPPPTTHEGGPVGALKRRRGITQWHERMAVSVFEGRGPMAELSRLDSPLVLVDVTQPVLSFACRRAGLPTVAIHTALPQTRDAGVPPPRTSLPFGTGLRSRVLADAAWRSFLAQRSLAARAAARVGACPPYELARRVAPWFGVPGDELDVDTAFMPQLRGTTELVLCPEALDFPRPPRPDRHYVESIDMERTEDELHLPTSAAGRPIVYASLGSQLYAAEQARRLLQLLVVAFRKRPSWQLVLSLGRYASVDEFGDLPGNVFVYGRVPQLSVLRRARVMVTHGGLGSIKECVINAVPMLVFPLAVDQPGNAARVVRHGLGLRGDAKHVAEADLLDLLDRLVHEDAFSRHATAFAATFERVEEEGRGASIVERLARDPIATRDAPA